MLLKFKVFESEAPIDQQYRVVAMWVSQYVAREKLVSIETDFRLKIVTVWYWE